MQEDHVDERVGLSPSVSSKRDLKESSPFSLPSVRKVQIGGEEGSHRITKVNVKKFSTMSQSVPLPDSSRSINGEPIFMPPPSPEGSNPYSMWRIGGNSEHGSVNGDTLSDNLSTGSSPRPSDPNLMHTVRPVSSEESPVPSPASPMAFPMGGVRSFVQPRTSPGSSTSCQGRPSPAYGNGSPAQYAGISPIHSRSTFPTPPCKYHSSQAMPNKRSVYDFMVVEPIMRRKVVKRNKQLDREIDDMVSSGSDSESLTSDRSLSPGCHKHVMKLNIPDIQYQFLNQTAKDKAKDSLRNILKAFSNDQPLDILRDLLTHNEVAQLDTSIRQGNLESERMKSCSSALHNPNTSFNRKISYPPGSLNAIKETSDDVLVLSGSHSSGHGAKTEIMQLLCLMSNSKEWTEALNSFYVGDYPPKGSLCICSRKEPAVLSMMLIGDSGKNTFVGLNCLKIIARKKDHPMGVWTKFLLQSMTKGIHNAKLVQVHDGIATFKIKNLCNLAEHLEQLMSVYETTVPLSTTKQSLKIRTKMSHETMFTNE
eukprot:TCALIF_05215-PA protein Name:"Protein of unknown function" AED:0.20 eAED:0.49 QI:0/0/0/0.5/0/0.25/4/0/536